MRRRAILILSLAAGAIGAVAGYLLLRSHAPIPAWQAYGFFCALVGGTLCGLTRGEAGR
jgi:uncharacterized membrane protein YeaQ/YmgE (transglycosylase-associated protein family)